MIWPDFCSALIVGRLAPLGLHNTQFRPVPVSCSPMTGEAALDWQRHEYDEIDAFALYESDTIDTEALLAKLRPYVNDIED